MHGITTVDVICLSLHSIIKGENLNVLHCITFVLDSSACKINAREFWIILIDDSHCRIHYFLFSC